MYYSSFDDLRAQYLFELKQDPIEQTLYHYTSPGGFDGILLNDNKTPTFWFSRYDCLNDITEGNNIKEIYRSVIDELLSYEDWDAVFSNHIRNVKPADQAFFWRNCQKKKSRRREWKVSLKCQKRIHICFVFQKNLTIYRCGDTMLKTMSIMDLI